MPSRTVTRPLYGFIVGFKGNFTTVLGSAGGSQALASVPQLMQIFHASHGDFETPSFVQYIEMAGVESNDLNIRTFRQTLRQLMIFESAANLGHLAHVIDFPLGIIHGRKFSVDGGT